MVEREDLIRWFWVATGFATGAYSCALLDWRGGVAIGAVLQVGIALASIVVDRRDRANAAGRGRED